MANPLIEFNDSQVGVVLGTALHTLGAIAFLGGLVGYLAWHRHLVAHGHHHRKVLEGATVLTYIAIFVNLLGGFMRTFESDHPHLTEWATSGWVRAVAIKHVFIFLGMGAAVYLFERIAPRLIAQHKAGAITDGHPPGHRIGVLLVALGILVSAILGAITQVVPPVAADAGTDDMDGDVDTFTSGVTYSNSTGQLSSSPVTPATSTGSFIVPEATSQLQVTLLWSPSQFQLRLDLEDPNGDLTRSGDQPNGGLTLTVDGAMAGTWHYTIASELAVNVDWDLTVRMASFSAAETVVANRVVIPPGSFYEVNTVADVNATLHWSWTTDGGVHFDIHTHFDDEVQYVVAEEGTSQGEGSYTVQRKGGHSYLWENTGTLPVTLDYRVWGGFELDSIAPA